MIRGIDAPRVINIEEDIYNERHRCLEGGDRQVGLLIEGYETMVLDI
jgi:hypothetical protein